MAVRLIGIDCATDDAKVGLALAAADSSGVRLARALVCGRTDSALIVSPIGLGDHPRRFSSPSTRPWLAPVPRSSPRGAPAGKEITVAPNDLFRRATDRFIQQRLRKTPLDVGADRSRARPPALRLLGQLRRRTGYPIPLAWSPEHSERIAAIEVYPAATLVSHGARSAGYKKPANVPERREIIRALGRELALDMDVPTIEENADALDAVVCVLAAKDFLTGAPSPQDPERAAIEGWIGRLTRPPSQRRPDRTS
jgi:hypothetical protein